VDRELHKDKSSGKAWMCFGNTFIRMPKTSAKHLLEKGWEFLVFTFTRFMLRDSRSDDSYFQICSLSVHLKLQKVSAVLIGVNSTSYLCISGT